jgi:telomere length regulation protein
MASDALRELRDTLRQPAASVEALISSLSFSLTSLNLHPTSLAPSSVPDDSLKAIQRYLPAIQLSLLTTTLPTFLHALNERDLDLVDRFFCPPGSPALGALRLAREVAAVTYATVPGLLSARRAIGQDAGLPVASRGHSLAILARLAATYGLDALYWGVWAGETGAEGSRDAGLRVLRWEEAVKAATSLPAKAANAVGRWSAEGWKGTLPECLSPRYAASSCSV